MYAVWNIETKIPAASSSLTIVQGLRRPPSCERKAWAVVTNSKDSTLIILNSQTTRALLSHGISIFVKIPLLYYLDSNHQPVIFNILIALQSLVPRLFIVFSEHNKWIINLTLQILFKKTNSSRYMDMPSSNHWLHFKWKQPKELWLGRQ